MISELWDNEYDFHFMCDYQLYNNEVNAQSQLASAAVKAQRAKFRFPRSDPQESDIQDTRTSEQKMSDILRIWSQCLTKDETQVWNTISERDLSRDISLKSGLCTCKSIIDRVIHNFKQISKDKQSDMLQVLQRLPNNTSSSSLLLSDCNSQPTDPGNNPEPTSKSLLLNESPAVSHLDREILSNFCDPVSGSQDENTINHCVKSDIDYSNLKNVSTKQVLNVRKQCNGKINS